MRKLFHFFATADLRLRIITAALALAVTLGAIAGLAHLADRQYLEVLAAQFDLTVPTFVVPVSAEHTERP
jgi:hypothetical protein